MGHKVAKTTIIITLIALLGKMLGLIKDALIASTFGAGSVSDAFFLSNTVIMLITSLILQAINTTTIPVLADVEVRGGKRSKNKLANNLLHIMTILSVLIVILSFIFVPQIISLIAPGFENEQYELAVRLTQIGLPAIILMSISGVLRGYLHSESLYTENAVSDLFINILGIITLIFIANQYGVESLMISLLIAIVLQILTQSLGLRKTSYRYKPFINIKDKNAWKIAYLTAPVFLSVGISNINKMIDNAMASTLTEGSISALNFAGKINTLVLGVFITSIITVIFPLLSKAAAKRDYEELKKIFLRGMNIILLITVPVTIAIIVLAKPIIEILFERGSFDSVATKVTSEALMFYSFALIGMSCRLILIKIYYSLQDTKTPLINGIITVLVNVILNIILIGFMEHKGLALATSISSTVLPILLLYNLEKKIGHLNLSKLFITSVKIAISSLIMGVSLYLLYNQILNPFEYNWLGKFIMLLILTIVGITIYSISIYLFRVEGMNGFIKTIIKRLGNRSK